MKESRRQSKLSPDMEISMSNLETDITPLKVGDRLWVRLIVHYPVSFGGFARIKAYRLVNPKRPRKGGPSFYTRERAMAHANEQGWTVLDGTGEKVSQ